MLDNVNASEIEDAFTIGFSAEGFTIIEEAFICECHWTNWFGSWCSCSWKVPSIGNDVVAIGGVASDANFGTAGDVASDANFGTAGGDVASDANF